MSAPRKPALGIGGLAPFSTCDWPGKLVATVFCQGCPWDCAYCHNPDLIDPRRPGAIAWEEVLDRLRRRRGLLDAVVFSGGEPTRQELRPAIADVRGLGLGVGLHTSGAYPRRLAVLAPLVDWVGLDVKALPGEVEAVARAAHASARMAESLDRLVASGTEHQVRTTWGPGVMSRAQAEAVRAWAVGRGAREAVLQAVRAEGTRPEFAAGPAGRPPASPNPG
ncbi:MAG: anaerobic ribonucleoside-triphosphate reductase activating protein [Bifidobacteriaceae bacterium]|nr:anaerobic ribonucleoside-triphosphate reductase activating protein [Bifidobacteriaceae bacterium]